MSAALASSPPPEAAMEPPSPVLNSARPAIPLHRASLRTPAQTRPRFPPRHGASWRRLLGLSLLGCVVFLWTASGFLQSAIYADNTYSKPYFVTYFNTASFTLALVPYLLTRSLSKRSRQWVRLKVVPLQSPRYQPLESHSDTDDQLSPATSHDALRHTDSPVYDSLERGVHRRVNLSQRPSDDKLAKHLSHIPDPPLTIRETFFLSFKFSMLWFLANYFNAACLHYTTVASSTILSTTSSVFTLVFGAVSGVEKFTAGKLFGVLACLAGVGIISSVDVSGGEDTDRGSFPSKTSREITIGDTLAVASAILYGLYCVLLVKTIGDESRVKMPVFFGFLGLVNIFCMWPGFLILQWAGIENFELPPSSRVWCIILLNAGSSLFSDFCWAYAMLFTSPLVVTVGLSLTIPLSLVGQMVIAGQYSTPMYWLGAVIVVLSFLFINHETKEMETVTAEEVVAP